MCCLYYSSAGVDYDEISVSLTFFEGSGDGNVTATAIGIIDDVILEGDEFFRVHVTSEERVVIQSNYTDIHIVDDDSKFMRKNEFCLLSH